MSGDARGLREGVQGVPLFKVYGKHFGIEPREVGELLLDVGEEFIAVGRYPVPVPPVDDMVSELPAPFEILPPFVMIAGGLRVVVVHHHPQHPILQLVPFEQAVDGFVFRLIEL